MRISGLPRPTHIGAHAGNERRVEQLAHGALEADPMHDVAGAGVDDVSAAARFAVPRLDVIVKLEPLKGAVARQRGAE